MAAWQVQHGVASCRCLCSRLAVFTLVLTPALQQMERFKACEKEMKTKAFSKEGLIAAAKMDPAERAKADLSNWLSSSVDELSHQVEGAEAELETLAGGGKKKKGKSDANERIGELERLNERREWHVQKREVLLRLLENGQLETDAVAGIKDDIAYFVESNAVSCSSAGVQRVAQQQQC